MEAGERAQGAGFPPSQPDQVLRTGAQGRASASRDHPLNPALCLLSGRSHAEAPGCLSHPAHPTPTPSRLVSGQGSAGEGHLPAPQITPRLQAGGFERVGSTHISVLRSQEARKL